MKKLITLTLTLILTATAALPTLASDYNFNIGADSLNVFGKGTGYDEPTIADPLSQNTRKNKDAAYFAPPYGIFSGELPTNPSSPYHQNPPVGNQLNGLVSGLSGGSSAGTTAGSGTAAGFSAANPTSPSAGSGANAPTISAVNVDYTSQIVASASGLLPSTSQTSALNTTPWKYDDNSIGTIYVERTKKTIKVYEGESLANLKIGAGHFSSTSAWDGNVALAGHNRGSSGYFGFVKDLQNGDILKYTTKYGTRTYQVFSKTQINEYDNLPLSWSDSNILTLITCVANIPENRYAAVAKEI